MVLKELLASKLILDVNPKIRDFIRAEMRKQAKERLTVPQFRVLNKMSKHISLYQKELADWMGVTPATITRMIDNLSSRGFVERKEAENDKRQTFIVITPIGKRMIESYRHKVQTKVVERLRSSSVADLVKIIEGLTLLQKLF